MNIIDHTKDARRTILSNRLRSTLSSLGIIIGVLSVVVLLSIGKGAEVSMKKSMGEFTKNYIYVTPGGANIKTPMKQNKTIQLSEEHITYILKIFPQLSGSIVVSQSSQENYAAGPQKAQLSINGVSINWLSIMGRKMKQGSRLTTYDQSQNARRVVVTEDFRKKFYPTENIIGKQIRIGKQYMTVIGVLEQPQDGMFGMGMPEIYMPLTTMQVYYKGNSFYDKILISLQDTWKNETWLANIKYALLKKHDLSLEDAGFSVYSNVQGLKQMQSSMNTMKYFLLLVGGISLIVGGIGVMNIMLVSVTERTREIGIRKAIGALNKDIIMQFLIESIVITLFGGVIALILSYSISFLINQAKSEFLQSVISFDIVMIALTLTTAIGILFGILPARKAAKLRPIDALRFE